MKKIGIMSMQRIKNYGSFLQAYGLRKTLVNMGYDVQFVDYEIEPAIIKPDKKSLLSRIVKHLNIFKYIQRENMEKEFGKRYEEEFLKELNISTKFNYHPNIEHLVIGSDEVFNCLQSNSKVGYSRELFGKNYENIPVSTYAACFGKTTYNGLVKNNIDKEVGKLINNIENISVRDKNSWEIIKELTGRESNINLDPVLITDFSEEVNEKEVKYDNYIIVYAYKGRISKEEQKKIKKFAKKNKKTIISIGTYQEVADINLLLNPFELLAYFKKADFVITDTFHGTVFSIKFNTNFATIIRDSNKQKLEDLLNRLKLESRKIDDLDQLEYLYQEKIDFNDSNEILRHERKSTYNYLKESIDKHIK